MTKFRVEKAPFNSSESRAKWFEEMAADGWQLVTCYAVYVGAYISAGTEPRFVFKKEIGDCAEGREEGR